MVLELTNENFEAETKSGIVVVDFWAEWCGPCKMLGPNFAAVSEEMTDIKFAKVNVDEAQEVAAKFNIRSIPTIKIFKDGAEIGQLMGALPKEMLKTKLEEILG